MYAALYDSIAAHSRHGLNVVVDVGHHDAYSTALHVLADAARRLDGRSDRTRQYAVRDPDGTIPAPVLRWQQEVHVPGIYDLEVDTATMTPAECAELIRQRLEGGPPPTAFRRLASQA